jgi:phospholipid/cholesterol/gamma-HCH transport system ATP-binding protein
MVPHAEPVVELQRIVTRFGSNVVHDNLSLTVHEQEVLGIVGGSGTGKSVLLRQMLGLSRPSSGSVRLLGEDIARLPEPEMLALRRKTGVLFQGGALFSALSVLENVALPLRELQVFDPALIRENALQRIRLAGLGAHHADKMPAELSGGMIKRIALARALALEPRVLFVDEPTAGLDPESSDEFVDLIQQLRRALHLTVVMITHDLDTLVALCDRIAVLADRTIIAVGPIEDVVKVRHPFIENYFLAPRGARALSALPAQGIPGQVPPTPRTPAL